MTRPPVVRVNEAILLLAGAVFLVVMVAPDDDRFYWTPLVLGLSFLAAAVVGGRAGGTWAPACVLVGWGAAVVFVRVAEPDLDTSGVYLAGAGAGVLAGLELGRRGFAIDPAALGATTVIAGAALALTRQAGVFNDARAYAALLALIAVAQLVLAARRKEEP
jgi:hypothetical protein